MTRPFLPSAGRLRAMSLAALLVLGGCASSPEDTYVEQPVEQLYNQAMDYLENREFERAAKAFEEVERQHPYSLWATKAQLMGAYALYERSQYDEAIIALDRFIQLHPGNRDVDYAYYLKALSYYEQIADVGRDQKMTENALKTLQEVVDRFPNSQYARDARLKIDLARDHLAGKEMNVGRYYLRRGQYLAAINRFRNVVDHYQTTSHVPEALHRLIEAYTALGLEKEAMQAAAVLGHNYPGSEWYVDSYGLVTEGEAPGAARTGWFRSLF
ncbi:outer membrane protein assembly factor BamD [Telmatospirillum sp. J64-1]|uniref:outer membrane protein assembly factor BamD n=1 Tax=Telmatospirillum sp. J64-1 TaxID=2502183 RepID=UPI00115D1F2C|nr:outer membrane protein assembly factor BamD [Telmatospirillum sp. J64-1]